MNLSRGLLSLLVIFVFGCGSRIENVGTIRIVGSETMHKMCNSLAEEYMKKNPGISIYVNNIGTATGIRSWINGDADICSASRTLTSEEVKLLYDKNQTVGISHLIAKDAIIMYTNPKNPIDNLSMNNISDIYQCRVQNWSLFSGIDRGIKVISRNTNSGTFLFFRDHFLLGDDYCNTIVKSSLEGMIDEIVKDETAIGYGGIINEKIPLKRLRIDGVDPSVRNIKTDKYPIVRYLYFYTVSEPQGIVKSFIDWVMSEEGQEIIKKTNFIPLWEKSY